MMINSPTDGRDALGYLGLNLDTADSYLDSFLSKGYIHGYSTHRKLVSTASNAYQARRETDDAKQNVGFIDTLVDVDSLLTFAGSTDTRLEIIYDQVGSSDATSNVADSIDEHRLANSGSAITYGSVNAMEVATGTIIKYDLSPQVDLATFTLFYAIHTANPKAGLVYLLFNNSFADYTDFQMATNIIRVVTDSTTASKAFVAANDTTYTVCITKDGADVNYWVDNVDLGAATTGSGTFNINAIFRDQATTGTKLSEIHLFDNVLAEADRNAFNLNLNSAHGI